MCVVDPMANLKVAIHRAARDHSLRQGVGPGTFLPATRLIIEVFDATRDLELTSGLLEEASLLDAGVAQAMISLHLHAARFVEACRTHSAVHAPAEALLSRETFNRLTSSVLTGKLAPAGEVRTATYQRSAPSAQPAIAAASVVEASIVPMANSTVRAAWPAPDRRQLVAA